MQNSGFHGNEMKKNFKILLLPNWLADFQIIRFLQAKWIGQKIGQGFALYGYSENLKNLLRKCQDDFQIIL